MDGATNQRGSGVGLVLLSPKKITIEKSLRLGFLATNNEAEYEALLIGMMMVQKMGGKTMKVYSDSKLVVGQVRGDLEARDPKMQEYLSQVRSIQTKVEVFDVSHVPRGENTHADSLATLATSSAQDLPRVILIEDLCTPTSLHKDMPRIHQFNLGPSWMDPISLYLERDILPEEKSEAEKVRRKAPRFWLSEVESYTSVLSLALICFVYTLRHQSHSWKSYMKEFMGVTQGEDPYLIGLLLKDTGGQACKKRHRNMLRSVISVKNSRRIFTSLEEFSIPFLALGRLLNGA